MRCVLRTFVPLDFGFERSDVKKGDISKIKARTHIYIYITNK